MKTKPSRNSRAMCATRSSIALQKSARVDGQVGPSSLWFFGCAGMEVLYRVALLLAIFGEGVRWAYVSGGKENAKRAREGRDALERARLC